MFKRKPRDPERVKRRRYAFFKYGFFCLLALLLATVYWNYDYWIFKILVGGNYIFTDAMDSLYADSIGADNVKGYMRDFDRMVMATVTAKIRTYNQDRYTYLYTPQNYQYSKTSEKEDAKTAHFEALTEDAAYLYIPNVSTISRQFVESQREALKNYDYLVLDLRGNYGGLLEDMYKMADLFVDKGALIGYERTRLAFFTRDIQSKHEAEWHFKHIVILQDQNTASAAEGLILALKQNLPHVTLLGGQTFGKGIGQVTIPLTEGYAIRATVLLVEGPDGINIHRVGIPPDIVYEESDIIEKALDVLNLS